MHQINAVTVRVDIKWIFVKIFGKRFYCVSIMVSIYLSEKLCLNERNIWFHLCNHHFIRLINEYENEFFCLVLKRSLKLVQIVLVLLHMTKIVFQQCFFFFYFWFSSLKNQKCSVFQCVFLFLKNYVCSFAIIVFCGFFPLCVSLVHF